MNQLAAFADTIALAEERGMLELALDSDNARRLVAERLDGINYGVDWIGSQI